MSVVFLFGPQCQEGAVVMWSIFKERCLSMPQIEVVHVDRPDRMFSSALVSICPFASLRTVDASSLGYDKVLLYVESARSLLCEVHFGTEEKDGMNCGEGPKKLME